MAVNRFLTVDIGASTLKVGEFVSTGDGHLSLVNFGCTKLGSPSGGEEDVTPQLKGALERMIVEKQFKARRAAISVSGQQVLTRFLKLPAADETKIRQMVRFEAAQNVPFPIEEVVWDYQVLGSRADGELDVVMVAIKSEIIEGFNTALNELGIQVEVVDVSPLCMYNALLYNYDLEESLLLLDIGARTTNLIFAENKKVFTRSIPIAGNTITQSVSLEFEMPFDQADALKLEQGFVGLGGAYEEPEIESAARLCKIIRNVMTRLHAEITRSINFYKTQQGGKAPKRLLLSGGTSVTSYMDYFFKDKMEIEVEYFNPFKNVPIQVQPQDLEKVVHTMGEVVGLGLRLSTECPIEINLVPPSVSRHREFLKKIPYFTAALVGVLCIFLSWWLYYWKITSRSREHLDQVQAEVSRLMEMDRNLKSITQHSKTVEAQLKQIDAALDARYYWVAFLNDLNRLTPKELWITEIIPYENATPVVLGGETKEGAGQRRGFFDDQKDAAASLKPPEIHYITDLEIHGAYLVDPDTSNPLAAFKPFQEFSKNLEKSAFFKPPDEKDISAENPESGDWTAVFKIRVKLKEPLPY
jgi:type IV pilus assembly protein PilM